jgi:hypothetical protein
MSQENLELFHKGMEAFLRHDIEPLLETSDPEIDWYPFSAQVEGDVAYHGHQGVRRWWANLNATFEEFEATIDEVRDEDDIVMALGRLRARFKSASLWIPKSAGWSASAMASPCGVAHTKAMPMLSKPPGCRGRRCPRGRRPREARLHLDLATGSGRRGYARRGPRAGADGRWRARVF